MQQAAGQVAPASPGQAYMFNPYGSSPVYMSPVPAVLGIPWGMSRVSRLQTSMNSAGGQPPPFDINWEQPNYSLQREQQ